MSERKPLFYCLDCGPDIGVYFPGDGNQPVCPVCGNPILRDVPKHVGALLARAEKAEARVDVLEKVAEAALILDRHMHNPKVGLWHVLHNALTAAGYPVEG